MSKNKDVTVSENPLQWIMKDFKEWRHNQFPTSNAAYTASLASTGATTMRTQDGSTRPAVVPAIKIADDALISWKRGRRDSTLYTILENNNKYTDWVIKMTRQFTSKDCQGLIKLAFKDNQVIGDSDITLFKAQLNHMSIVLERVLKTTYSLRLSRKYYDNP